MVFLPKEELLEEGDEIKENGIRIYIRYSTRKEKSYFIDVGEVDECDIHRVSRRIIKNRSKLFHRLKLQNASLESMKLLIQGKSFGNMYSDFREDMFTYIFEIEVHLIEAPE